MDEGRIFLFAVVLLLAIVIFVGAFTMPQKIASSILIAIIPFQPLATQYATANTLLIWVVFIAMVMRGRRIHLAMLPQILLLLFAYLLSMGVQHSSTYVQHGIFVFNLVSACLLLWIAYDLCVRSENIHRVIQVFLAMNVLVCIYCVVQMTGEPDVPIRLFGIEQLSLEPIVKRNRLTGPFSLPGLIAEFFVIMFFLAIHQFLSSRNPAYRRFLIVLSAVNLGLLVATGNRGGFLTLVGAGALFLWLFRGVLGTLQTIRIGLGGAVLVLVAGAITVNYTAYDALFDRLAETSISEGVPDTRAQVWPAAWREILRHPILGHGPRLRFTDDEFGQWEDVHTFIRYPHNLYLFLLFTVGVVGTIAFLVFLATPLVRCWLTARQQSIDQDLRSLALVGVVIMAVIFVDQMKVEFMRLAQTDYWHFVFALFGVLIGACDRARIDGASNRVGHP